ncbi:AAA family ATPase [Nocardioides sp.]|uniref:ATP-binding protein n=1 Tax=Nocardioides sp. TaxID=35761 RepID=UPI0027357F69|nr:AAA family ATPase [Nocardioides sp.]MDP3890845.1 AAA family ATPase [Nocardioides sp.]
MDVHIQLLGRFEVVVDGIPIPGDVWTRRHAAGLVKLLALAHGRRLHREQVIDALWPETSVEAALPRLHKAAHYARRGLGGDEATTIVLRRDLVTLLPDAAVTVDAVQFRQQAETAVASSSREEAAAALDLYDGDLLPEDAYEPWVAEQREALRLLHVEVLRLAGRWQDVLQQDAVDEEAHLALAREQAERGDVRGALRQLERMDQALRRELGTVPSAAAESLRRSLASALPDPGTGAAEPLTRPPAATVRLVARRHAGDDIRGRLERADAGEGSTLLVTGPPGVGKTAVLDLAAAMARRRGWRIGRGTASAVEGPWPYASVLEALGDLCRSHPTLLDGLDDQFRDEIERAMSGAEVSWTGESAHQRLFVATAELLRIASAGHGVLLVVDDIHEADEASLRLLHYLARCAVTTSVVLMLAHRAEGTQTLRTVTASLTTRGIGSTLPLGPLDEKATRRLIASEAPGLGEETVRYICAASGGLPFAVHELVRTAVEGRPAEVGLGLPPAVERTFARVALLGTTFSTDELVAVAGVDEETAYQHLHVAHAALVVEPADTGHRFRHALVRETLLERMPPAERAAARLEVAHQLSRLGAAHARVAHQFLAAGRADLAVPYVLPAVETAGALGAYRDALALVDAVRDHVTGQEQAHLLARRGDLLMALGDPDAVAAYRAATAVTTGTEHRLVRARLARAACFAGELDTAEAALAGLELERDAADGPILLARGNLAYFTGDIDAAWDAATEARKLLLTPDDPWHYVDLVALQGLIAHQRGEWFERFRLELRRTSGRPGLATALFDAHLCVAEYLLYGPVPYPEVITLAEQLRGRAARAGALRGVAFATALIGEAALLMGDLDRAERELLEAVDLHRDVDAAAGEAHSLQRLAEVRLARGEHQAAQQLLQRALPLARWSVISMHLLQRIYGTMIAASPDPVTARAMVDRAEATIGDPDSCPFCDVMLAVPATIACAAVGDVEAAQHHLAVATVSASRWEGSAWEAAVLEARAHVARAEGDAAEFGRLIHEAASLFAAAGQPGDRARCESALELAPATR